MAATSYVRSSGVPCSQYIDDRHRGQLRPRSKSPVNFSDFQLAEMGTFIACTVLLELAYFLSIVKSVFIPLIKVKFLEHICQSGMPKEKVLKFASLRNSILDSKTVSLKKSQQPPKLLELSLFRQPRGKNFGIGVFSTIGMASFLGKMKSTSPSLFSVMHRMVAVAEWL